MKEEVKKKDPVEAMIAVQLEKFEVKPEDLQKIVNEYSELVVTGVDDKSGRKAVSEARKKLKSIRNQISNDAKDLRENFNKVSKAIIVREKELIAITLPEEERLEKIEADIALQEEEIRKQKELEEQERILARTNQLTGYGATFNGVQYELGDNIITMAEVKLFTEIEFTRKMEFFKEWQQQEAQLKLEAEIARQVMLDHNKKDVEDHLVSSGFEYELSSGLWFNKELNYRFKNKSEFESEESVSSFKEDLSVLISKVKKDRIDAENKRIADEKLKAEQERLAEIKKAQEEKQAELDRKQKELDDQLAAIEKQKQEAIKKEQQRIFDIRQSQLFAMGFTKTDFGFNLQDVYHADKIQLYVSDSDWNSFVETINKLCIKKQEEDKVAAEAEEKRKIEMAPDKEVLKTIADNIKASMNPKPVMKTAKGTAVLNNINELKNKIVKYIEDQTNNL